MMIVVRGSLLVMFVPLLAFADASTPRKAAKMVAAPTVIEYSVSNDGRVTATQYEPGLRLYSIVDGRPLTVVQRRSPTEYVVEDRGSRSTVPFFLITPFAFSIAGQRVVVDIGPSYKIEVRAKGMLDLEPAGQGYLSQKGGRVTASLVDDLAPVPLIKVSSRPEACSDYWDIYVSVVDGVPRKALELYGLADPPTMSSPSVKLDKAAGTAVVTTTTSDDDAGTERKTRKRYKWNGSVFVEQGRSKRSGTESK